VGPFFWSREGIPPLGRADGSRRGDPLNTTSIFGHVLIHQLKGSLSALGAAVGGRARGGLQTVTNGYKFGRKVVTNDNAGGTVVMKSFYS